MMINHISKIKILMRGVSKTGLFLRVKFQIIISLGFQQYVCSEEVKCQIIWWWSKLQVTIIWHTYDVFIKNSFYLLSRKREFAAYNKKQPPASVLPASQSPESIFFIFHIFEIIPHIKTKLSKQIGKRKKEKGKIFSKPYYSTKNNSPCRWDSFKVSSLYLSS